MYWIVGVTPLGAAPATNINYSLIDMAFQLIFHYLNEPKMNFEIPVMFI